MYCPHNLGQFNGTEVFVLFATKATPGYARGEEKLIARGKVDNKKAP